MYLIHIPFLIMAILAYLPNPPSEAIKVLAIVGFSAFMLMIPVCIISFVFALLNFRGNKSSPLKTTMIVKLCLIPWYVFNFLVCAVLVAGFMNPWLFLATPLLIFIEVASTYIFMLSTGAHSIIYIIKNMITKNVKPNAKVIIALVFQLFFCLDIVGSIMLNVKGRKKPAENLIQ